MQFKPHPIVSSIQKAVDAVTVNLGLDRIQKKTDAIFGNIELAFALAMYNETKNP